MKYGNKNCIRNLFTVFSFFGLLVFVLISIIPVNAQNTEVKISPSTQDASYYSTTEIVVYVRVEGVSNLYGYQFDVSYDKNVLRLKLPNAVTEENFLKKDGANTFWIDPDTSTSGLIDNAACTRKETTTGVSGSGDLAKIRFEINPNFVNPPTATQITLQNVKLSDIDSQSIPSTVSNGAINVKICLDGETKSCGGSNSTGVCEPGTRTCSNNQWGSCQGGVGPSPEICDNKDNDCDGRTDNVPDTTNPITQGCSVRHQGICAVGTESCAAGSWSGCPSPQQEICWNGIDEDCDGEDSNCEGDITGDGCIDISDLATMAIDFGKTSGFINPNSDINNDGEVDIYDLVVVGKQFGSEPNC